MAIPIDTESRVSEALAAYMERMINNPDIEEPVTLALVRDRLKQMAGGWLAQLAGEGISETGNEQNLLEEIDALVARYGADAIDRRSRGWRRRLDLAFT
ncbi:MAG TPA: hypothetical protein VFB54_09440 [Burkholderiales bacterium]|nr:hypothetical protein [Burkholderiales bacterium]